MRRTLATLTAAALLGAAIPATADIFPRTSTPAGSVISRKSGEEVSFIDLPSWRGVDVHQDLLPGDTLRTNAEGHLALLFADNTQIRMARNTTLVVKQVGAAEDTLLGLEALVEASEVVAADAVGRAGSAPVTTIQPSAAIFRPNSTDMTKSG